MSGLRQKQKERRERDILAAAAGLIAAKGYNSTSIEEIAELAEVGVGTVYNYFHSKLDLVLALFLRQTEALLEEGQVILQNPSCSAPEGISALLNSYVKGLTDQYEKRILRELFAATFSEQASFRERMFGLDLQLVSQLAKLIEQFQKRGQLDKVIQAEEAATILYAVCMSDFMAFLIDDDMTLEFLTNSIERHVLLIFKGLSPH